MMQENDRTAHSTHPSVVRTIAEVIVVVVVSVFALVLIGTNVSVYLSPLGMLAGVGVVLLLVGPGDDSLREYGFRWPASPKNLVLTTLAMIGIAFSTFVLLEPLLEPVFGLPDYSIFEPLAGNVSLYVTMLAMSWIGAAFGEEVVYRGFIQTRLALAAGGGNAGWWLGVVIQAGIFAMLHLYQGWTGVIEIFVFGVAVGWLYWKSGRSLVPLILGHGIIDTLAMTDFYLDAGILF